MFISLFFYFQRLFERLRELLFLNKFFDFRIAVFIFNI